MNRFIASVALPCLGVALSGVAVAQTAREDNNTLPGRERALNIAGLGAADQRSRVFYSRNQLRRQHSGAVSIATRRTPRD